MALFRMAFFRLFALVFRHFAWRISFFRLFAWRYFVFSLFRLAFFRYFVFSLGVISSWRRAITPGEKTKERNNEMAQTSHHTFMMYVRNRCVRSNPSPNFSHRLKGKSYEVKNITLTSRWVPNIKFGMYIVHVTGQRNPYIARKKYRVSFFHSDKC